MVYLLLFVMASVAGLLAARYMNVKTGPFGAIGIGLLGAVLASVVLRVGILGAGVAFVLMLGASMLLIWLFREVEPELDGPTNKDS